jgi:aerobic carbon-monoxide dehydrogenase medium subunit
VQVPASFDYVVATSVDDAIARLKADDDARAIAGGHSLLPMMKLRLASPGTLIDISGLSELRYVRADGDVLRIGALATHADILSSPLIAGRARVLIDAERVIADPLVRNMGTVGGSVAHADAAEDLAAALVALDAIVTVRGPGGSRDVGLDAFYVGPYTTVLEAGEIVTEIRLPRPVAYGAYLKVERRTGDWAAAAIGVTFEQQGGALRNVRIGMCAVGPTTLRATNAQAILEGAGADDATLKRAAEAAAAEAEPITDARGSVEFKRGLIRTLLPRAVRRALNPGGSNGAH